MKMILAAITMSIVLFSCAPSQKVVKIMQNTHDKSPAYQDGFVSGCGSGFQQSGIEGYFYFKDILRYKSNEQYREGWQSGFKKCS